MRQIIPSRLPNWARQLTAFVGVGMVATAVDYGVFLATLLGFGINATVAALIGYGVGGGVSYALTRSHVFTSTRPHRDAAPRFIAVMAGGFVLTGVAMRVFTGPLGLVPILARILTYGAVLTFNFIAHRFFTFRG